VGALLDLLYPPFCALCRLPLVPGRRERDPVCARCWERLERIAPPVCGVCGLPLGTGFGERPAVLAAAVHDPLPRCGACRAQPPAYRYARAPARYEGAVRDALHALKFDGRRSMARPLGALLAESEDLGVPRPAIDLLVPVPLHRARRAERGFNQAELLARELGRAWSVPVAADVLARARATRPQTELGGTERRRNVRGAFALARPERVAGRHVLLIDDVLTTGTTVAECARAVRAAGASAVGVLTVARVAEPRFLRLVAPAPIMKASSQA
jgi:ComF family protein